MDHAALRAAFPVLASGTAYLNAGTCGPIPRAAAEAAREEVEQATVQGRATPHFERLQELARRLRAAYAERLGTVPEHVALTTSTSEGMVRVLAGLRLRSGQEILTSTEEHPGLLGPLGAARERLGVEVRAVPRAELPGAVGPQTALVACSHVGWVSGDVTPPELAEVDVPVLLDGAQGAGAVAVDVDALGCAFYAAAGQKWLCGPVGTGSLYVAPAWRERIGVVGPTYLNLEDPAGGLDSPPHGDARAFDTPALSAETMAFAVAAHDELARFGWPAIHERAATLAERLVELLRERGRTVAARGRTTLVAWEVDDPVELKGRLADAGVILRDLPGTSLLRASVGAWNDEDDLERVLAAL